MTMLIRTLPLPAVPRRPLSVSSHHYQDLTMAGLLRYRVRRGDAVVGMPVRHQSSDQSPPHVFSLSHGAFLMLRICLEGISQKLGTWLLRPLRYRLFIGLPLASSTSLLHPSVSPAAQLALLIRCTAPALLPPNTTTQLSSPSLLRNSVCPQAWPRWLLPVLAVWPARMLSSLEPLGT